MTSVLNWLVIAMISLALGLGLALPGSGIELSNDESLSSSLALQKKTSDNEPDPSKPDFPFEELLATPGNHSPVLQSSNGALPASLQLTAALRVFFGNATPRAPPPA